ncbi:MAG TPA: glycoside hydrolase family 9 protein [Methylomirabilota bacterium]|nr:glycoside hydrolase family 9 protein [Methylomirabilota bacterium]
MRSLSVIVHALIGFVALSVPARAQYSPTNPAAMPAVGAHELRILTPTLLELTLITTKEANLAPAHWNFVGENFTLQLPAAAEFGVTLNGSPVSVTQVGFKRRPLYAPLKKRDLRIANHLYLSLAQPVQEGEKVVVKNASKALWDDAISNYSATADPLRFNPAIHVNQVGYSPTLPKRAMVGFYIGTFGELSIPATTFTLVDAKTGATVFSGQLTSRKDFGFTYSPTPYQQVHEADFSGFTGRGEFRIQVPGMGGSYPFLINDGASAAFARSYALGMYHQRCGTSNSLPHTRHEHGECHVAPAAIPTMDFAVVNNQLAKMSYDYANNPLHTAPQLKDVNSSLYPFVRQGTVNVARGHHDAGDYSKYTINSAGLIHHLVFAADAFPGVAHLDNLGLPESGDGKSDILQEAKWEADFLAQMQDLDGGFYFLVYPKNRAYEDDVLPDAGDPQVVFPKTTAVTAAAVGALAEIASSPKFKTQFPSEAAAYMRNAHLGWQFLTNAIATHGTNGSYQKITHYGNEFMHKDEIAWAAAAMFAATGEEQYADYLKAWYDPADSSTRRWSWWRLFEGYGSAARTYAFAARSGRVSVDKLDAAYLAKCEAEIIAAGNDIERFARETAYGTSFPDPSKAVRSAGWYFSSERAFELATAQQLQPKQAYLDALASNFAYEAGCNPVNMPYITGVGWQRWRDVVLQYAQNDRATLPPSGITLGNIQGGFAYLDNYKSELGQLCYPPDGSTTSPYPFYDRFGDSFNTTTEFVVVDQARALGAAAYLMAQSPAGSAPSANGMGVVAGLPLTAPAEQPVTASFVVAGVSLEGARVVWEASGQEPFIGNPFVFAPKAAGEQWVEVEAQLPDGTRYFARTNFTATYTLNVAPNAHQSEPLTVNADTAVLYHLDAGLEDAAARNGSLVLAGNAQFDNSNIGWMSQRSGSALRFFDLGDNAKVTIPSALIYTNGETSEITVEAMVFINGYKGWARGSAEIVSLIREWDASLRYAEDTWAGAHIFAGNELDVSGATLKDALPLEKWHHLGMTISSTGYSVRVNGQALATKASASLPRWGQGSAQLQLGNFDGWIDEVVVRVKSPATPTATPAPPRVKVIAPAAPTGLAALPGIASVQLGWSAVTEATSYNVLRALSAEGPFETVASELSQTVHTDSAAIPGVKHHYVVTAVNAAGTSVASAAASATPLPTKPSAPVSFVATATSANSASLTWTDASTNEDGFVIYRSLDNVMMDQLATLPAGSSSWSDAGLLPATRYYYYLAAYNVTAQSAGVEASITTLPLLPTAPTGLTGVVLGTSVTLNWASVTGAASYAVYRASAATGPFEKIATATANSWINSGLQAGTTYYFQVAAVNAAGEGPHSTTAAVSIAAAAPSARFLGQDVTTKGTWRGVYGNEGYAVLRHATLNPSYGSWSSPAAASASWADPSSDVRALQKTTGTSRIAASWQGSSAKAALDLDFTMKDLNPHRVSFYMVDFDRKGRSQRVDLIDRTTSKVVHSQTVSSFGEGIYLTYEMRGNFRVRITPLSAERAAVSGIFYDAAAL